MHCARGRGACGFARRRAYARSAHIVQQRVNDLVRRPGWRHGVQATAEEFPVGFHKSIKVAIADSSRAERYRESHAGTALPLMQRMAHRRTHVRRSCGIPTSAIASPAKN